MSLVNNSGNSKIAGSRGYLRSSSFQMALLFTVLLGGSAAIMGYVLWQFNILDNVAADKLRALVFIAMLLMGLVVLASYGLSSFVVSRTNRIASAAQRIMETGDLSQRLDNDTQWDDLGHMTGVLNALLDRIETLVTGVRQVSDNIAHDLRTPLTRLRGDLETLRANPVCAQSPEAQVAIDKMLAEADQLLGTFGALLRIARIETMHDRQSFAPTDIAALMRDVVELYEPLMEDKGQILACQLAEVPPVLADKNLLFQTFTNIVDNAVKFTPSGGKISIQVSAADKSVAVIVADTGGGIPQAEMEKVFDRFYRTEKSRTSAGNGLGLSLVDAVLGLHGARRALRNVNGGLEVVLTFAAA